jgi:adenylate cyclase
MSADADQRMLDAINRRLNWQGWVSNGVGSAVVSIAIALLLAIFFDASERDELLRDNIAWCIAVFFGFGIVITWLMFRRCNRAFAWITEGRDPTEAEYKATLGTPAFSAYLTGAAWMLGGAIFTIVNLDHSVAAAAVIGASVWLGGETTSALAYLLTERTLRPVTAKALTAREPTRSVAPGVRDRLLAAWSLGTGAPIIGVVVVGTLGLTTSGADGDDIATAVLFMGAVALCAGMLFTLIAARAIADPLNSIRDAVEKVAAGDLEATVEIDDASEIGLLQAGFNRMAGGLRERERIRDIFGRHVGEDVARSALDQGTRLGGEEREIGAIFVDLAGSTSMAQAMPPTEVVRLLNRFFRVVIEVVETESGYVNKFEGDAALCVFGAPADCEDPAGKALCAARTLAERLQREVPEIGFGIGVSAGRAVAGNVGSERRFEYTVIGDPVNEAARLCDLVKERGEAVMASDAALSRANGEEIGYWREGERTILRGRIDATVLATPLS